MSAKLVWITPEADELVVEMARVSNPANKDNLATAPKLIKYLIDNGHWSPFEMVDACIEITTTRDISRQMLRHHSARFQEFSGRYAVYEGEPVYRAARMQDPKNRQNSLACTDDALAGWWLEGQKALAAHAFELYHEAIKRGIAKEQARAVLPEGLTPTTIYMKNSLRGWIHYWVARCDEATQQEHREVAELTSKLILSNVPMIREALGKET